MQICNIVVAICYYKFNQVCVITSAVDGVHSEKSLHKKGRAVDYRTWYFEDDQLEHLVKEIRKNLPSGYDVVLEQDHLHIEYDPYDPKVI